MKKLITLILALAGMVTVNAADDTVLTLHYDNGDGNGWDHWSNFTNKGENPDNTNETVYEYVLNSSNGLSTGNVYFGVRIFNYDNDIRPYDNANFSFVYNDGVANGPTSGKWGNYNLSHSGNIWGNGAFVIEHSTIKASEYKITVYSQKGDHYSVKVEIVSMPLTISDASGYATFSCDRALDFSSVSGLTAYVASAPTNGNVTMTAVDGAVPANTGLFIKGTASATPYEIPVITTSDASSWSQTNYLHPTDGSSVDAGNYVFAKQDDEIGFYKLGAATAIDKGKAYLNATAAGARLSISFNDAAAITSVKNAKAENSCFDLQGRRVANPTKGLYINGKKVIK